MAKIGRLTGPSNPDGSRPRVVKRTAGTDVEILGSGSDLYVAGGLTIAGDVEVAGTVHVESTAGVTTGHDAVSFDLGSMIGTATLNTDTEGLKQSTSYFEFPGGGVRQIHWKWFPWSHGELWEAYRVNFGWIKAELAGSGEGTVVWRYYENQVLLNDGVTGTYNDPVNTVTAVDPGGAGSAWNYTELVSQRPVETGPLGTGPVIFSVLERDVDHEDDTLDNRTMGVFVVTATRQDP